MVKAAASRTFESSWVPASGRKIRDARYSVGEDRFIVTFDSGKEYSFPRVSLQVDDGSDVLHIQVDRKRYFVRVTLASGSTYEIPWDRVLYEAEPAYAYFRARKGRSRSTRQIGTTIRELREAQRITQEELARAVGMMRSNISRIEAAKHRPTLETVERIAKVLKVTVADLVAAR